MATSNNSTFAGPSDYFSSIRGAPQPAAAPTTLAPGGAPPLVSRPEMEDRHHARRLQARKINRWKGRFEGLLHELERRHHPIRHDVRDGDIEEALDVAIQDVCLRMTPLSPEEARLPGNAQYKTPPLQDDVALALGGRIYAVVRWMPDGPRVHKFSPDSPTR